MRYERLFKYRYMDLEILLLIYIQTCFTLRISRTIFLNIFPFRKNLKQGVLDKSRDSWSVWVCKVEWVKNNIAYILLFLKRAEIFSYACACSISNLYRVKHLPSIIIYDHRKMFSTLARKFSSFTLTKKLLLVSFSTTLFNADL